MKKTTCDHCKKDIADMDTYHLILSSNTLDNTKIRTAIMRYPLVERDHHFCDFQHLQSWIAAR